jgi:hypothetical protein
MTTYSQSVVIELSVDHVFAFVTCVDNNPRWQPSLVETGAVKDGPADLGSRFWERRRFMGISVNSQYVIEEFDPPCLCAVRSVAGPMSFHVRYRLQPAGASTVMCVEGDLGRHGLPRLAVRAAALSAQRELATNLRTLKRALETVAAPLPDGVPT